MVHEITPLRLLMLQQFRQLCNVHRDAAGLVAVSSLAVEGCDAAIGHWANAKIVPWITSDLPNDR